jgi:hypothetical protein
LNFEAFQMHRLERGTGRLGFERLVGVDLLISHI